MDVRFFRPVIGHWPTIAALAMDLRAPERTVRAWWQRDSVPADWFAAIARAGRERGFNVTVELLAAQAEAKRLGSEQSSAAA